MIKNKKHFPLGLWIPSGVGLIAMIVVAYSVGNHSLFAYIICGVGVTFSMYKFSQSLWFYLVGEKLRINFFWVVACGLSFGVAITIGTKNWVGALIAFLLLLAGAIVAHVMIRRLTPPVSQNRHIKE